MTITGLNLDISWKNKPNNFEAIENAFRGVSSDIFVLPEMFSTGFCMEADEIADRNKETLHWMKAFAKNNNAAICGSASVKDGDLFYNRMYFVKPDGSFSKYDKRHLFSFSGEDKIYTKGSNRIVVEYLGIRFLLQVCYDLRFPVFSRNNDDYDAILYVANWPEKRVEAWEHLLKARAIENLSYVFGINRVGTDGNALFYKESSHCFFADGTEISEKSNNLVTVNLDIQKLQNFRKDFGFLNDRDGFDVHF